MMNSLINIKKNLKKSIKNNHYIYNDLTTKFIYDNSSLTRVVGINKVLQGKIVEIINEFERNEKKIAQLKIDDEVIGWTEISDNILIRLYRVPKISGKLNPKVQLNDVFSVSNSYKDLNLITDKILKVHYIFYHNNQKYLNVSRIDGKSSIFIKEYIFNKLIFLTVDQNIYLKEKHALYNSSNFNNKVGIIKIAQPYKILSFINNTNEVKIEYEGNKFWIKIDDSLSEGNEFQHDVDTLEVIDFITYLSEKNKYNENQVKILNNKINRIGKSITYHNENEEIQIKKYLGEYNDN